ncbi:hypothetical protein B0A55_12750, partial [Friedmanniomyces simplex]
LDIYNVSTRVSTDTGFFCLDLATAYAVAKTHTLPEIYYYQFNRSYQIPYWPPPPNKALCNAPPDAAHPGGNPDSEYFKCHSGDLTTIFGTWRRWSLPERDENDTPFTQFIIDSWSSWVRTWNPNPDPAYLQVRGYANTTRELALAGSTWQPVDANSPTLRKLQWPSSQQPFREAAQCAALSLPLDYFFLPGVALYYRLQRLQREHKDIGRELDESRIERLETQLQYSRKQQRTVVPGQDGRIELLQPGFLLEGKSVAKARVDRRDLEQRLIEEENFLDVAAAALEADGRIERDRLHSSLVDVDENGKRCMELVERIGPFDERSDEDRLVAEEMLIEAHEGVLNSLNIIRDVCGVERKCEYHDEETDGREDSEQLVEQQIRLDSMNLDVVDRWRKDVADPRPARLSRG